jgi:hypothetical protein
MGAGVLIQGPVCAGGRSGVCEGRISPVTEEQIHADRIAQRIVQLGESRICFLRDINCLIIVFI